MPQFSSFSTSPEKCREALLRAAFSTPIIIDLETTGLHRHARIVAAGIIVGDRVFALVVSSIHLTCARYEIGLDRLRAALEPLATRTDMRIIMHNAQFDLGVLRRDGITVAGEVIDTLHLTKLLDSDRGKEKGGAREARFERRYKEPMNYKLKNVVLHELDIKAPSFPGQANMQPFGVLVQYLVCDLISTSRLYQHLLTNLSPQAIDYFRKFVAPVTPMLVEMTHAGVLADREFAHREADRLRQLMQAISDQHFARFGQRLDVGDSGLREWIFERMHCPGTRRVRSYNRWVPSLKGEVLEDLRRESRYEAVRDSLGLILDYFQARTSMRTIAALDRHIDRITGRIHTRFIDQQAAGRFSATKPNLQAVTKTVAQGEKYEFVSSDFSTIEVRARNVLVASPGHQLVAFDVAQADIRCLAAAIDSFRAGRPSGWDGAVYLRELHRDRESRFGRRRRRLAQKAWDHFRRENVLAFDCPSRCGHVFPVGRSTPGLICPRCGHHAHFDLSLPRGLTEDFNRGGTDFYIVAAERMLGRPPENRTERNFFKQTVLSVVNGKSAVGLAKTLRITRDEAGNLLRKFATAYPEVDYFTRTMHEAIAITSKAETFGGRQRRVTPHWWMVENSEVELFISYRGADKLWLRVVPFRPSRHTLTCYVLSVVDANDKSPRCGQEIYHHRDGRISQAPYRFFNDAQLVWGLPVRNISWRLIRRVRTLKEEARYEGFDRTRRQLFNLICQGGTADLVRLMMVRSQPVCAEFGAKLLLQIHDELVFEVPEVRTADFVRVMQPVLEQRPTPDFTIPIVVEPKVGTKFGEMRDFETQ